MRYQLLTESNNIFDNFILTPSSIQAFFIILHKGSVCCNFQSEYGRLKFNRSLWLMFLCFFVILRISVSIIVF